MSDYFKSSCGMGTEPPFTTTCQSNSFSGTRCANCRTKQWVWETACTLGSADGCLDCLFSDRLYSCDIWENHMHFLYRLSKVVKNRESWKNSGIMHQFIFLNVSSGSKWSYKLQTPTITEAATQVTILLFLEGFFFYFMICIWVFCMHACLHTTCMPRDCGGQVLRTLRREVLEDCELGSHA